MDRAEMEYRAREMRDAANAERDTDEFMDFRVKFMHLCRDYVIGDMSDDDAVAGKGGPSMIARGAALESFLMEAYLLSVVTGCDSLDGDIRKHLGGISKAVTLAVSSYLNEESDCQISIVVPP